MSYGTPKGARERIHGLDIPAEMFTWKPDEDDIKGLMETLGISSKEIAKALDIPLQRVTAAIAKPRKGTYMPNPHAQSTRTLIMLYLNSAPWREANGNRRDDKRR